MAYQLEAFALAGNLPGRVQLLLFQLSANLSKFCHGVPEKRSESQRSNNFPYLNMRYLVLLLLNRIITVRIKEAAVQTPGKALCLEGSWSKIVAGEHPWIGTPNE